MPVQRPLQSNSSVAVEVEIICKHGDTFSRKIRFWQDAAATVPLDVSASTFKMNVIVKANKAPTVIAFDMGSGITFDAINIISLDKTAEEIEELQPGRYNYDLEQTKMDGSVLTILKGFFTVEPDVTR